MKERSPDYAQVRASAEGLSRAERLRLIAELAAGLAEGQPAVRAQVPLGDNLWGGFLKINDRDVSDDKLIVANGIDAESGEYLLRLDPAGARRVAAATQQLAEEQEHTSAHKARSESKTPKLGTIYGVSHDDLAQAGWAVVVAEDDDTRLLDALAPLIKHRCAQQAIEPPRFDFLPDERCGAWFRRTLGSRAEGEFQPMRGEPRLPVLIYSPLYPPQRTSGFQVPPGSCRGWLARYGVSVGPVDPSRGVPFYLLIAGRPGPIYQDDTAYIPFSFQYDLDVFWGVGRLCFTDEHGDHDYAAYRSYAEHVVAFETDRAQGKAPPYGRQMVYFATRHERDPATEESEAQLVVPLAGLDLNPSGPGIAGSYGFDQLVFRGDKQATKDVLGNALCGRLDGGPPAVLFSASHGVAFRPENALLPAYQGALICQGWSLHMPVNPLKNDDVLFSAESFDALGDAARVSGMVAVMFACYGVGCPRVDTYAFTPGMPPATIAPRALVAQLPQRLLSRGALAVLGHVDKAWSYGFARPDLGLKSQPVAFREMLARLLNGERLGYVTDQFNMVQSTHAGAILDLLDSARFDQSIDKSFGLDKIGELWKAYHDMRSYLLLGDPAVRLPFAGARPVANFHA